MVNGLDLKLVFIISLAICLLNSYMIGVLLFLGINLNDIFLGSLNIFKYVYNENGIISYVWFLI